MPDVPVGRPTAATSCCWKSRIARSGTVRRLRGGCAYAGQAAIAARHAQAPSYEQTDWPQIAGLYEVLLRIAPSPVIELNHAAAVSMVDGPAHALRLIDAIEARGGLKGYELLPAVRADLLRRLGRTEAARDAYLAASAATQLEPLRRLYARRIRQMDNQGRHARA